jgi:hypothetical protein
MPHRIESGFFSVQKGKKRQTSNVNISAKSLSFHKTSFLGHMHRLIVINNVVLINQ